MDLRQERGLWFSFILILGLIFLSLLLYLLLSPISTSQKVSLVWHDNDHNGQDSPGDVIEMTNGQIYLRFDYVDVWKGHQALNTFDNPPEKRDLDPRWNGYYLQELRYRNEVAYRYVGWDIARQIYPTLSSNDVIGLVGQPESYPDNPFLSLWNSKESVKNPSYKWYVYFEKRATRKDKEKGPILILKSDKGQGLEYNLEISLKGPQLFFDLKVRNKQDKEIQYLNLLTLPANKIIDTNFGPPELLCCRQIEPLGFTENFTFTVRGDGLAGSGMLPWKIKRDTKDNYFTGGWWLLHQHGLFVWKAAKIKAGGEAKFNLVATFSDENIYSRYERYLKENGLNFEKVNLREVQDYFVRNVPRTITKEGWVYHAYEWPTNDWHNEMTGKAFMTMFYLTGDKTWLNYTVMANKYYLEKMRWNSPEHPFYGYFMDQTVDIKQRQCFLWSQPYNVESLLAEYPLTENQKVKEALLLNFEKVYSGLMWNPEGKRWFWRAVVDPSTKPPKLIWKDDLNTFDACEFGIDVMLSAYSFTGDKKYLRRAVEAMENQLQVLENYGLLLEDHAGEPSVNVYAFAAKVLYRLYDYTGEQKWLENGTKILDALLMSFIHMDKYQGEFSWLKGGVSRKDGDWTGQFGEPTTGTDSSVATAPTYIPWIMEALVAGYKHTGKKMYLDYAHQLLWHSLEANKKMKEATGGKFEFCGHFNTYLKKFYEDDDSLVIVSNLYELPYLQAFEKDVRVEHSDLQEIAEEEGELRLINPTGSSLKAVVHLPADWLEIKINSLGKIDKYFSGQKGAASTQVKFNFNGGVAIFNLEPYSIYHLTRVK
ncbi:MAG: hypothetical protein ACPLZD_05260 [Candidatus Saccharicenans sp.]|nr:MAG: hypothetical protein C0168_10670 [Candidatus Aminicenantes bacterium]HEK84865.1 hypothetical protein [Candidatus Aminicenantes bacterium]